MISSRLVAVTAVVSFAGALQFQEALEQGTLAKDSASIAMVHKRAMANSTAQETSSDYSVCFELGKTCEHDTDPKKTPEWIDEKENDMNGKDECAAMCMEEFKKKESLASAGDACCQYHKQGRCKFYKRKAG